LKTQLRPAPKAILRNGDPRTCNLAHRRYILERCATDMAFREEVWIRCARDFVWWADTFAWTLASKDNAKFPKVPFILYPFQEDACKSLISAIGKEDRLIEKSRDVGATWIIITVFVWLFIFQKDQSFLVGSRKQEYVDKAGSPKTLFYKIDFLLDKLPGWMRPPIIPKEHRTINHIENPLNGSVIDGESTNENFGAGDRRAAALLDEFALSEFGFSILGAIGDVTDCCIYNSTPLGASGAYYDTREQMLRETPDRIIRLHWSVHPRKRIGLYQSSKDGILEILDKEYHDAHPGYKFICDGKLRSVAYDNRERRAANKQIMAQQWDIDYLKSGWQFFDPVRLEEAISNKAVVRPPVLRGELLRDPDWKSPNFLQQPGGRLKLWAPLPHDGKWPVEWDDVVIGCDIASGSGGEKSSNSSASIARRTTGEKIGELTDNNIFPGDFALYVLALATWFNDAFIIWERNGPNGSQFGRVIKDSGYRKIFYPKKEARFDFVESKEPGFWTGDENKPVLLGKYAEALWSGAFSNPSEEALIECGQYVQNGKKIEHSRSLAGATEDPTAIGESHGDRVIGDALCYWGILDRGLGPGKPPEHDNVPVNSAAYRRRNRRQPAGEFDW
jgi:hypothetical protein